MKALITGITGFAGSHLAELLLKEGHKVYGLYRWRSPFDNIKDITSKVTLLEGDLVDAHSLDKIFKEHKFDWVFHLAAQSFVPTSWVSPTQTFDVNVIGSNNLFESIRKSGQTPVIQIACSSEEYGFVKPEETPIAETNELRPLSPYAVSKVAMDYMGYQYYKSYGMKIIRTRGFNHTGPRRGKVFVTSNFAKQIAEIEKGKQEPVVYVGNLDSQRDFTDVRDMVKGYYLAVQKCESGEVYNIASEKAIYIKDMLNILLSKSTKKIEVRPDEKRMRPSDVTILLGNAQKFKVQTGWNTTVPFEKTMEDLLNYWRERV